LERRENDKVINSIVWILCPPRGEQTSMHRLDPLTLEPENHSRPATVCPKLFLSLVMAGQLSVSSSVSINFCSRCSNGIDFLCRFSRVIGFRPTTGVWRGEASYLLIADREKVLQICCKRFDYGLLDTFVCF